MVLVKIAQLEQDHFMIKLVVLVCNAQRDKSKLMMENAMIARRTREDKMAECVELISVCQGKSYFHQENVSFVLLIKLSQEQEIKFVKHQTVFLTKRLV